MLSKATQARLTMHVGAGSAMAGTYGWAGWPAAAALGGAYLLGFGLMLVDVDQPEKPKRRRVIER